MSVMEVCLHTLKVNDPFFAQYQQLVAITHTLIGLYPAIADNITGHSDIAPARKTDPGPAFDWPRFRAMLTASSE